MMNYKPGTLLLLVAVALAEKLTNNQTVSVNTTIGIINGKLENITFLNKTSTLYKFLGIPFAEPPTGNLRFKKPFPKSPLTAPLNAFAHNNACLQRSQRPNITYSEDCLYLNIYTPERDSHAVKLPVMVWIYGGGFNLGDANMYIGDRLAIWGDVIVVTLNYRVSIFGFLSTGDDASPGNYGLWDQRMAIEWVHDNIAAFGGDPDKVTIFGQSAGSASVIYQGLYSGNSGLFQRVIAESGSIMAFWGSDEGIHNAKIVGSIANCDTTSTLALVACLKSIPANNLTDMISNPPKDKPLPVLPFVPAIDNDFIYYNPKQLFLSDIIQEHSAIKFFAELDFMTGVNAGEGVSGLQKMFGVVDPLTFLPNRTYFENRLVPILVKFGYGENVSAALDKAIIAEYTNWSDPSNPYNIRDEYVQMYADFAFNAQMYLTLDTHSAAATTKNTYMYYLTAEPHTYIAGKIPWFKKPMHGADLPFIFGFDISYKTSLFPVEWELNLSKKVMTLWTNFAKTGDPNSPNNIGLDWKPYTARDQYYLDIARTLTSSNVKQHWNDRAPYFWYDVVPSIIGLKTCH